ncbi:MAG: hypothetical protein WEC99_11285 [Halofilum sp. (in: g-proteobacteria)]
MRPRYCSAHRLRPQWLALAALAATIVATPVDADVRVYGQVSGIPALAPGVGFALHLAREDLALDYGSGEDSETLELRRLGLTLSESVGERTRVGLRLGRLWASQSGRPALADVDPRGHYLDLALATEFPLSESLHATLDASWRYAVADATEDDSEVDLEWQTWALQPGLRVPVQERAAVRLGASFVAIDGHERVRGPTAARTDFESDGNVGAYLALDLMPRPDDVVSFQVEGGPRTGVYVSFEHRY